MELLRYILMTLLFLLAFILGAGTLIPIPAMLSLPSGIRPGIEELTIDQAVDKLSTSGRSGWDLVKEARNLTGDRMNYCRRNNYQHFKKAFYRGYGFCQQKAFALSYILNELGFEARPVQAYRNRFEFGVGGHSWVEVNLNGEIRYVDPQFQDRKTDELMFKPLTSVTGFNPVFRIFSSWGSGLMNSLAYYRSGSDLVSGESRVWV